MLAFCLAVLSARLAFTQTPQASPAATTPADPPVAYVYVGTTKGVNLYNAAANGALTLVSGSPFKTAGAVVGSNRKFFISQAANYLHSYPIAANGAIKQQVSQTNYAPGCATSSAVFDHTGQEVYVQLAGPMIVNGGDVCDPLQSFKVSSTSGSLTFIGSTSFGNGYYEPDSPITITGNDAYAYDVTPIGGTYQYKVSPFHRESSGALDATSFNETDPTPQPGWFYIPVSLTADPTNHLAVALALTNCLACSPFQSVQLASYTVDAEGNITSTNTWGNIPVPDIYPGLLNMSPSGDLLAVAENRNGFAAGFAPRAPGTNGLQIFHFNGANPITPYSKTLTTAPIDQIHWDNNNHLYALSDSTNKLYVYTVTPTTIAAAPGSPYTITGPNGLVVVPILCSAPTSPGVHICSPASGSTVHSPVLIDAASTVTGTIARMEVWVDGVKKYTSTSSNVLNTSITLAAGKHRFGVFAINSAGQKWENAISATVQ